MSPTELLRADAIERGALLRVLEVAGRNREKLDRRLAVMIVSELASALKRGR